MKKEAVVFLCPLRTQNLQKFDFKSFVKKEAVVFLLSTKDANFAKSLSLSFVKKEDVVFLFPLRTQNFCKKFDFQSFVKKRGRRIPFSTKDAKCCKIALSHSGGGRAVVINVIDVEPHACQTHGVGSDAVAKGQDPQSAVTQPLFVQQPCQEERSHRQTAHIGVGGSQFQRKPRAFAIECVKLT